MKSIILSLILLVGAGTSAFAQCSGGSNAGSISTTTSWQTIGCVYGGEYYTFSATNGTQYTFSFCQGGGSATWDTQITILTNGGAYAGGYNDDNCSLQSEVTWTAPSNGTFRVLINQFSCSTNSTCGTLAYREAGPVGPGTTCANPYVVPSLPFVQTGMTTCGYGDDYDSGDACGTSYMNGDDFVFTYTTSGAETIEIITANTGTYVGISVMDGCPSSGGTSCIAPSSNCGATANNYSFSGNPSAVWDLPGADTYYIVISTFPSPQCSGFDIDIHNTTSSSSGPGCGNYTISNPAYSPDNYNSGTTLSFPDDEFSSPVSIPFTFCFMGVEYNSLVVSSNAHLTFTTACAGEYSSWDTDVIPSPADVNSPEVRNSILGPWVDIDPSVSGTIKYATYGTAPNRRFVVSWRNVAMYSFSCNSMQFTGQITLYETTNVIDNYIQNLPNCPTWNNGEAVLGLWDASGTVAVPVPGYNNTQYTLSNYAVRYTPNCPTCNPILPVAFEDFDAVNAGPVNALTWSTSYESNSREFIVERSPNGQQFEAIDIVEAKVNDPRGGSYRYEDNVTGWVNTYYRIRHVDANGFENVSEVVRLGDDAVNTALNYVRVDGEMVELGLSLESAQSALRFTLLDGLGRELRSETRDLDAGNQTVRLTLGDLSAGYYFVRVSDGKGLSETRKFVLY